VRPAERGVVDWNGVWDQAAAMEAWRRLAPSGATAEQVIASIPATERRAMAFALVRDGNFKCDRPTDACTGEGVPVEAGDGLGSPCLRETLVDGLLLLDTEKGSIPDDVAAAVAASGSSDIVHELGWALLGDDLLAFLAASGAAGDEAGADLLVDAAPDVLERAVRDFHLDAAVTLLEPSQTDALIGVLSDDDIGDSGKRDALFLLNSAHVRLPIETLIVLTHARDCSLASDAAARLADLGRPEFLPGRPATTDPAVMTRALCLLEWSAGFPRDVALAAGFVGDAGLVVQPEEGEPAEYYPRADPALGEEVIATIDALGTRYDFAPGDDGNLRLTRIWLLRDVAEPSGCGDGVRADVLSTP
jgi:hypothetical protein